MSDLLVIPEGSLIEVSLRIKLPHAATPEQITEWLEMEIGGFGTLDMDNPLARDEPQSFGFRTPKWEDTGLIGREECSARVKTPTGET